MTDTQAQEALRLADWLRGAVATYPQVSECEPGGYFSELDQRIDEAAALLRSQAARIAELEKAHAIAVEIGAQYAADREALAAELARMREPLSDEQIKAIGSERAPYTDFAFARAIEAAHGITAGKEG